MCGEMIKTPITRNFARTIFVSRGDYREIFIKKYCIAENLHHLACNTFRAKTNFNLTSLMGL